MTANLLERVLAAIDAEHSALAAVVESMAPDQLALDSAAAGCKIHDVLAHLGCGAEVGRARVRAATDRANAHPVDIESIWARWGAWTAEERASHCVRHSAGWLEDIRPYLDERSVRFTVGLFPETVPLVTFAGLRLSELAFHSWDIRAGIEIDAEVNEDSAHVLFDAFRGPLALLLDRWGPALPISEPIRLAIPGGVVVIDEHVRMLDAAQAASTTLHVGAGAVLRLLSGRLRVDRDASVRTEGPADIETLRSLFQGH